MSEVSGWRLAARFAMIFAAALLLAGCQKSWKLDPQDFIANKAYPPLKFDLVEAETGNAVTQADFRSKIVMLYFGYTNCPNVCPLTLSDTVRIFHMIGKDARDIRFLFVTVDPRRDTLPVIKKYIALYGSKEILGLRGGAAGLHDVATRYHAGYSVHPSPDPTKYTVTHSAAITVFNREGKAEFIITGLASQHPDLKGIARDLNYLTEHDAI